MTDVRITAIIPTYNRASVLPRCIHSALAQTFRPQEVLIVDDGSTDDTRAVVDTFGSEVMYLFQQNAGASAARNVGALTSSCEWLAFLDSDDEWVPDYLERVAAAIRATSGRALQYFADVRAPGDDRTLWERGGFCIEGDYRLQHDASDWCMRALQPMTTQATVIRKDAYARAGGQQASLPSRQDTHLFFMLGFSGPACAVAGVGGLLLPDADEGSRLTQIHQPASRSYCEETIWLYRDLLGRYPDLSQQHRAGLRRRLAAAHWQRARLDLADRRLRRCVIAAATSGLMAPSVPASRTSSAARRTWRRLAGSVA